MGQEFIAAYRAAEALASSGCFSLRDDFWCCDRLVNVTRQVGVWGGGVGGDVVADCVCCSG